MSSGLARLAALTVAAGMLLFGSGAPALAQTTININPGNVPTTAADFQNQECVPNLGGNPVPNRDVWAFDLPGDPQTTGVFESVTATFQTPNGQQTVTIPTDGGAIVNDTGTSKAWIRLPAGWTLTGATAEITGTANFFVLTHTCPASGKPSASSSKTHLPVTSSSENGSLLGLTVLGVGAVALGTLLIARYRRRNVEG